MSPKIFPENRMSKEMPRFHFARGHPLPREHRAQAKVPDALRRTGVPGPAGGGVVLGRGPLASHGRGPACSAPRGPDTHPDHRTWADLPVGSKWSSKRNISPNDLRKGAVV